MIRRFVAENIFRVANSMTKTRSKDIFHILKKIQYSRDRKIDKWNCSLAINHHEFSSDISTVSRSYVRITIDCFLRSMRIVREEKSNRDFSMSRHTYSKFIFNLIIHSTRMERGVWKECSRMTLKKYSSRFSFQISTIDLSQHTASSLSSGNVSIRCLRVSLRHSVETILWWSWLKRWHQLTLIFECRAHSSLTSCIDWCDATEQRNTERTTREGRGDFEWTRRAKGRYPHTTPHSSEYVQHTCTHWEKKIVERRENRCQEELIHVCSIVYKFEKTHIDLACLLWNSIQKRSRPMLNVYCWGTKYLRTPEE